MTTNNTLQINPITLDLIQSKPGKKDHTFIKLTALLRACGNTLEKCSLNCSDISTDQNTDTDPNILKEFKWKLDAFTKLANLYALFMSGASSLDPATLMKKITALVKYFSNVPSYASGSVDYFKTVLAKLTDVAALIVHYQDDPSTIKKIQKNLATYWDAPAQGTTPAGPGLQSSMFISDQLSNTETKGVLLTFLFSQGLTVLNDPNADKDPKTKALKEQIIDILFDFATIFMNDATNATENHGSPSFDQNFFDTPAFHGPRDYTDVFAGFINQYFNYKSQSKSKEEIDKEKKDFEHSVPGQHTGQGSDINTPNWNKCQPYLKDLNWQDKWSKDGYSPNGTGFMNDFLINICDYLFS